MKILTDKVMPKDLMFSGITLVGVGVGVLNGWEYGFLTIGLITITIMCCYYFYKALIE